MSAVIQNNISFQMEGLERDRCEWMDNETNTKRRESYSFLHYRFKTEKKTLVLAACLTKVNFYSFAMKCAVKLVEACLPERAAKQNGLM